jgi:hypothetical protein
LRRGSWGRFDRLLVGVVGRRNELRLELKIDGRASGRDERDDWPIIIGSARATGGRSVGRINRARGAMRGILPVRSLSLSLCSISFGLLEYPEGCYDTVEKRCFER